MENVDQNTKQTWNFVKSKSLFNKKGISVKTNKLVLIQLVLNWIQTGLDLNVTAALASM